MKVLARGKAAVIGTTAHHLFLDSTTGNWVPAGQLKAGMKLSTISATQVAAVTGRGVGAPGDSAVSGGAASRLSGSKTVRRGVAAGLLGVGLLVGGGTGSASAATVPATTSAVPNGAATASAASTVSGLPSGTHAPSDSVAVSVTATNPHYDSSGVTRYDLTIDTDHTYYVVVGATPILVHNCGETEGAETPHSAEKSVAVLGRQADTAVVKAWPGHEVLDLPDWTIAKNDRWVQSVIDRKMPVYVTSTTTWSNLWDSAAGRQRSSAGSLGS